MKDGDTIRVHADNSVEIIPAQPEGSASPELAGYVPIECCEKEMMPLLTLEVMEKINGGDTWWCGICGILAHRDLDGKIRYCIPRGNTNERDF